MTPLVATLPGAELKAAAILTALLAVSAAMWAGICLLRRRGQPIIPLARRRPVPWQAQDLLMIFVIGIFLVITASRVVHAWVAPEAARADDEKPELAHPAASNAAERRPRGSCRCRRGGGCRRALGRGVSLSRPVARLAGSHLEPRAEETRGIAGGAGFVDPGRVAGCAVRPGTRPFQSTAACAPVPAGIADRADDCRTGGVGTGDPVLAVWRGRLRPTWAGNRRNSAPTPSWASWPCWP